MSAAMPGDGKPVEAAPAWKFCKSSLARKLRQHLNLRRGSKSEWWDQDSVFSTPVGEAPQAGPHAAFQIQAADVRKQKGRIFLEVFYGTSV
ncbi:hypothetical protein AOLI_G00055930 [Acnodon oligacanthus]